MNKYEVLGVVGEGAYGVVLRCRNKETSEIVAIKKFKESDDDEILRKTTLREVKILRMLRHFNIVSLLEAFRRKTKLYLVFEYVERNLLEVLEEQPRGLPQDLVKIYIFQLCQAIHWCHTNDVIHRDIKPENLLVDGRTRTLKLCDFGFARLVGDKSSHDMTDYVATRWYRAPELLLGSTSYDFGVDLWAIGCILGEITDGQPLFPGESEIDQLYIVQKLMGPLTPEHLDMFMQNPRFAGLKFPDMSNPETLQQKFMGKLAKSALMFMRDCLNMEPNGRPSSTTALAHTYFEDIRVEETKRLNQKMSELSSQQPQHRRRDRKPSRDKAPQGQQSSSQAVSNNSNNSSNNSINVINNNGIGLGAQAQASSTSSSQSNSQKPRDRGNRGGNDTVNDDEPMRGQSRQNEVQSIIAAGRQALVDAGDTSAAALGGHLNMGIGMNMHINHAHNHAQGGTGGGLPPRSRGNNSVNNNSNMIQPSNENAYNMNIGSNGGMNRNESVGPGDGNPNTNGNSSLAGDTGSVSNMSMNMEGQSPGGSYSNSNGNGNDRDRDRERRANKQARQKELEREREREKEREREREIRAFREFSLATKIPTQKRRPRGSSFNNDDGPFLQPLQDASFLSAQANMVLGSTQNSQLSGQSFGSTSSGMILPSTMSNSNNIGKRLDMGGLGARGNVYGSSMQNNNGANANGNHNPTNHNQQSPQQQAQQQQQQAHHHQQPQQHHKSMNNSNDFYPSNTNLLNHNHGRPVVGQYSMQGSLQSQATSQSLNTNNNGVNYNDSNHNYPPNLYQNHSNSTYSHGSQGGTTGLLSDGTVNVGMSVGNVPQHGNQNHHQNRSHFGNPPSHSHGNHGGVGSGLYGLGNVGVSVGQNQNHNSHHRQGTYNNNDYRPQGLNQNGSGTQQSQHTPSPMNDYSNNTGRPMEYASLMSYGGGQSIGPSHSLGQNSSNLLGSTATPGNHNHHNNHNPNVTSHNHHVPHQLGSGLGGLGTVHGQNQAHQPGQGQTQGLPMLSGKLARGAIHGNSHSHAHGLLHNNNDFYHPQTHTQQVTGRPKRR